MKQIPSKALEANIQEYSVSVVIDPKYHVIQEVMSRYGGLQKVLNTFLEELCHPRKNWQFIVNESRTFSLGYFYDLKSHPRGDEAVKLYIDIAVDAIKEARDVAIKTDSFHNLFLLIQKTIKESGEELNRFLPVIYHGFECIMTLPENTLTVIAKSYYQLKKLANIFISAVPPETDFKPVVSLLTNYYEYTFLYWLSEKDPLEWFESDIPSKTSKEISGFFEPISHSNMRKYQSVLREAVGSNSDNSRETLDRILDLPGYGDIVDIYKNVPESIFQTITDEKTRHKYKLIFLFHSMNIPGLSNIHEETLRDINFIITWMINNEEIQQIQLLIDETFSILKNSVYEFPETVLRSILNMGMGIYKTDQSDLVNYFNQHVVQIGFQTPDFKGITDDWQIQSNIAHIQNIRTWMELIKLNPKWSKKLLSSLIINLSLSGVLIKDTDLFPRDITGFLNSDLQPVFNLAKQLMKLFPSYFNEIGAEGQLRDISTRIDEVCKRKDLLVHFLRKQSHVESSNKIISLIESILQFWKTKSKKGLNPFLPSNIYDEIEQDGPFIDGVHKVLTKITELKGFNRISQLLTVDENDIKELKKQFSADEQLDIDRVDMAISFYKLLNQKYHVSSIEVDAYITQIETGIPLELGGLHHIVIERDIYRKISGLLDYLDKLKAIILSSEKFEIREDIYRKRHIAANIPSMYGSYREVKFDALGLTFRLESLVNTLFEELIEDFDLSFITHDTFFRIYKYLKLFHRALVIDGIPAREFEQQLDLLHRSLKIKLFTFSQYVDIFRGLIQVVQNIVRDYFENVHKQNLFEISKHLSIDKLLPKYMHESENQDELFQKVAEIFLRDSIASSLGIQMLDLFLMRISNTLHKQAEKLPLDKHYLLLTYNPRNVVTSITKPDNHIFDIVHLGNKALNIIKMKELGFPVPPGFIITTEVFRCRDLIENYAPATRDFKKHVNAEMSALENITGKKFGSPINSLLVSVRSGSAVSQPGMMDSYLNVGMNEEIVRGIEKQTGEGWFAWDSYRRFLQSYGMSFGISRDEFDTIIDKFKKAHNIQFKRDFTPSQMKDISISYRELIQSKGIEIVESPLEQLYIAITRVLNSWNSDKAITYRIIMGMSDDWGTAVTVQAMVFGNLSHQSGSGVLFTHSPKLSTDILRPWGDYTIGNQGEDVVSGLVTTYPISVYQSKLEHRSVEFTLEKKFPDIYRSLREHAKKLVYDHQWAPQDIEFTFEGPRKEDLHILQTRNMDMREKRSYPTFESTSEMTENILGHGIGVSGGAMTGRAVFCLDDITLLRKNDPDTSLILVRGDTVPDDIKEISAADGLLTARGGATSHAAIVANRLEKTCVVGCRDLVCIEKDRQFILNDRIVQAGEYISIDGSAGSIYIGKMQISEKGE